MKENKMIKKRIIVIGLIVAATAIVSAVVTSKIIYSHADKLESFTSNQRKVFFEELSNWETKKGIEDGDLKKGRAIYVEDGKIYGVDKKGDLCIVYFEEYSSLFGEKDGKIYNNGINSEPRFVVAEQIGNKFRIIYVPDLIFDLTGFREENLNDVFPYEVRCMIDAEYNSKNKDEYYKKISSRMIKRSEEYFGSKYAGEHDEENEPLEDFLGL